MKFATKSEYQEQFYEINIIDEQVNVQLGCDMIYFLKAFHCASHWVRNLDANNETTKIVVKAGVKLWEIEKVDIENTMHENINVMYCECPLLEQFLCKLHLHTDQWRDLVIGKGERLSSRVGTLN